MSMRKEQTEHFKEEACLKDVTSFREFVRPYLKEDFVLLDLGTGGGYGVVAVAEAVKKVTATDVKKEMLDAARATCKDEGITNVEFRKMAAEDIEMPNESFDAVLIRFSLHHFHNAQKALQEACRVLKPNGLLFLADAFFPERVVRIWTITSLLRHGEWTPYFTYREHMDMLENSGLQVKDIRPIIVEQWLDDFYFSAPENQRNVLRLLVEHLEIEEKRLLRFREEGGRVKYAYDGFELVAKKR